MTHMYFSARAEGRISYGHLGRTNSCFVCCFYLLFQLHIICYPALGPQGAIAFSDDALYKSTLIMIVFVRLSNSLLNAFFALLLTNVSEMYCQQIRLQMLSGAQPWMLLKTHFGSAVVNNVQAVVFFMFVLYVLIIPFVIFVHVLLAYSVISLYALDQSLRPRWQIQQRFPLLCRVSSETKRSLLVRHRYTWPKSPSHFGWLITRGTASTPVRQLSSV